MARSSNAPAPLKDRWQAVKLKQHHPEWTLRQIAGKIGRSHAFVRKWNICFELHGTVVDQPSSGRPQKMTTEAAQQAMTATQDLDCKTAGAIAVRVEQQSGVKTSHSTTTRYLRKQGLQHLRPRTVPILTAKHKAARLAFAKAALRSTFQRALVTDSKIFRLAPMGRPAGRWCTPATRGTVGKPKHSEGVHVYMGMSCRGVTTLRFVTGTHKHIDRYTNPKTQQLYRGVGSKEYNDVLQHHLIPEGNRLFQSAGQGIGSCSKTMLQLTRPRKAWLALLPMFLEGISWNGPQILLICPLLKTYGPGWTRNWETGTKLKTQQSCKSS